MPCRAGGFQGQNTGAVGPFVRYVSEVTGSHIIDGVTVPLRVRVSLTIAPERKLVEDLVRFLSRISVIIMTDRQKVTSIREKADPCDSSRNGRDALGLSAGRRDLIEERSSVLLFFF